MKKFFLLLLIFILSGCNEKSSSGDSGAPDVIITERFFEQQVNEIYQNHTRYLGKVIQYEGFFLSDTWNNEVIHVVVQEVLCCSGMETTYGFEILIGETEPFEDGTWVEVTGVLEDSEDGFIMIRAISIYEREVPNI
ncbi:MAG: hypothetical protein FWE27_05170 [Defluviitaleaceae bacterium]|nr:hypothetical protein [Defluviitaleaceae bacterium]